LGVALRGLAPGYRLHAVLASIPNAVLSRWMLVIVVWVFAWLDVMLNLARDCHQTGWDYFVSLLCLVSLWEHCSVMESVVISTWQHWLFSF
jgi:hypothetical protein